MTPSRAAGYPPEMVFVKRAASFFVVAVLAAGCGGRADGDPSPVATGGAGGVGGVAAVGGGGATPPIDDAGPPDVGTIDAAPPPGQRILFEVSYENHAWGSALKGLFITVDGAVYSYDYYASAEAGSYPPAVIFPATEQEIASRYGATPQRTSSVPVGELLARHALVESAAWGVLLKEYTCDDAGETSYVGYLYDSATARYTRVILGIDGDMAARNVSAAAGELMSWLRQFGVESFCEFRAANCTGAACESLPPTCPNGQVASVVGGCWGECVSVTRCLEVPDCSACKDSALACATSTTGSHHCLPLYCASADLCSCDFAPPCGGGGRYCTTTAGFEVQCTQPR
jgi:hypothetical protein